MSTFYQQAWEKPVRDAIRGGIFYDNTNAGANVIAAFSPVSLGTSTDVTNAIAAGILNAAIGELYVPTPITSNLPTAPIAGVCMESTYSGKSISVCAEGVFPVWANAAITCGNLVFPVSNTYRTSAQTPLTNNDRVLLPVMQLPNGVSPTLTYDLVLADDPAIVPNVTAGDAVAYYPLGVAQATVGGQYELIPVRLSTGVFYA